MLQALKVVLVGCPNVGKSVIFNYLTGAYVTVSNYPGTTVDIARGGYRYQGRDIEVVDTPGIYSLIPFTDEERVTRDFLSNEQADIIVHVVDAKNLRRMLPLTLQLIEAGLPVILTVNLIDEAEKKGVHVNARKLSSQLGIPVILTAATKGTGLDSLKRSIAAYTLTKTVPFYYSEIIERCISLIAQTIQLNARFSKRALALLLLQGDLVTLQQAGGQFNANILFNDLYKCLDDLGDRPEYIIGFERQNLIDSIIDFSVRRRNLHQRETFMDFLGRVTREPLFGIPILLLVLYGGLYQFVGRFGAGFLVDYIDKSIFAGYISPTVATLVQKGLPWTWAQSLIIGEYGLFSLGVKYAVVIVLPIVGTFFLMFAILEDCGYLPRLAMLIDRMLKKIGLNGRSVIPLTLGLGCGTMAVMVTRTLETKRERILATFLLSLSIPCSAQLGVVMAILSHNTTILAVWVICIGSVFLIAGKIASLLLPGRQSPFYMELPPLRVPVFSNIIKKAYSRMILYFTEILPVFVITSFMLWVADRLGVLSAIAQALSPVMALLGLPVQTADIFLLGFFRRDYGAAGLYDMAVQGMLTDFQLLVAAIVLTLFVPCIAQFMVMVKERGPIISIIMVIFIICIAAGSGMLVNLVLSGFF